MTKIGFTDRRSANVGLSTSGLVSVFDRICETSSFSFSSSRRSALCPVSASTTLFGWPLDVSVST
jgi:hypothetical protein